MSNYRDNTMNKDILDILMSHYDIKPIDIYENTDGANKVYIVTLDNNVKYVAKFYTQDIIPDISILNTIDSISKGNNYIPMFIKNKDGLIVSKDLNNIPVVLTTFLEGNMLGDDIVDWNLCLEIVNLLMPLHKIDSRSFNTDFWYKKANLENNIDFEIKADLSKCRLALIHGDLNHMNILTKSKKLSGVIDWDGLHKDFLVTDLAIFATHNLLKPQTKDLVDQFIQYYSTTMKLSSDDITLYYDLIKIRIKQIVNMLEKRYLDAPSEKEILTKYIAIWKDMINLLD